MVTTYPEIDTRQTPRLLAAAFLLYVFTLPLENLNTSLNLGSVTVPRLAGLLLFGLSLLYFSKSFASLPLPLWFFGAHVLVFGLLGLSEAPIFMGQFKQRLFTRIQVVVFFWLAANLMRD